jgi:hypothetical protein
MLRFQSAKLKNFLCFNVLLAKVLLTQRKGVKAQRTDFLRKMSLCGSLCLGSAASVLKNNFRKKPVSIEIK